MFGAEASYQPRASEVVSRLNTGLFRRGRVRAMPMPRVTLHTPLSQELSAGIVCFEVAGLTPRQVVERLRQRGIIASVTPYATSYARLAPGILNSEEEIDTTLAVIREL